MTSRTALLAIFTLPITTALTLGQPPTQSTWGEKFSTPGMNLTLSEVGRTGVRNSSSAFVQYALHAVNLPRNKHYVLWSWQIGTQPKAVMRGISLDSNGEVICAGDDGGCQGDKPNDPVTMRVLATPAEPERFALVSDDESVRVFASIVPIPIEAADKQCNASAEKYATDGSVFLIQAHGFQSGERLLVEVDSGIASQTRQEQADVAGSWKSVVMLPRLQTYSSTQPAVRIKGIRCVLTLVLAH